MGPTRRRIASGRASARRPTWRPCGSCHRRPKAHAMHHVRRDAAPAADTRAARPPPPSTRGLRNYGRAQLRPRRALVHQAAAAGGREDRHLSAAARRACAAAPRRITRACRALRSCHPAASGRRQHRGREVRMQPSAAGCGSKPASPRPKGSAPRMGGHARRFMRVPSGPSPNGRTPRAARARTAPPVRASVPRRRTGAAAPPRCSDAPHGEAMADLRSSGMRRGCKPGPSSLFAARR